MFVWLTVYWQYFSGQGLRNEDLVVLIIVANTRRLSK